MGRGDQATPVLVRIGVALVLASAICSSILCSYVQKTSLCVNHGAHSQRVLGLEHRVASLLNLDLLGRAWRLLLVEEVVFLVGVRSRVVSGVLLHCHLVHFIVRCHEMAVPFLRLIVLLVFVRVPNVMVAIVALGVVGEQYLLEHLRRDVLLPVVAIFDVSKQVLFNIVAITIASTVFAGTTRESSSQMLVF